MSQVHVRTVFFRDAVSDHFLFLGLRPDRDRPVRRDIVTQNTFRYDAFLSDRRRSEGCRAGAVCCRGLDLPSGRREL